MGRQTVDRLNPETADPPNSLERKRKAFARRENAEDGESPLVMPRKRMVRIATGSLSLIGDICQSNKERLDKQFDTQTSFFNNNGDNSEKKTRSIHWREELNVFVSRGCWLMVKVWSPAQVITRSSSTLCPLHWMTEENWSQLNLRWHFLKNQSSCHFCRDYDVLHLLASLDDNVKRARWQCRHCQPLLCHHNVTPGAVVARAMLDNVSPGTL